METVVVYYKEIVVGGKHSAYLVVFHKLYQGGELAGDCLQMIMVIHTFFSFLCSPVDLSCADHSVCWRDVTFLTVLISCGQFLAQQRDQDLGTRQG